MSFPQNAGQCPIYYNHYNTGRPDKTGFRFESRYIDIPTESFYPFGYGLSYSKFVYSKLKLNTKKIRKNSHIYLDVMDKLSTFAPALLERQSLMIDILLMIKGSENKNQKTSKKV